MKTATPNKETILVARVKADKEANPDGAATWEARDSKVVGAVNKISKELHLIAAVNKVRDNKARDNKVSKDKKDSRGNKVKRDNRDREVRKVEFLQTATAKIKSRGMNKDSETSSR